jgi:SAM-dependent methyltransferase
MLTGLKKIVKRYLLLKLLNGNNVQCNICGNSFSTMLPYLTRTNAKCPNCNSLERTRLLWYYIQRKNLLFPKMNLLHVAPESCLYKIFEKKDLNYRPIDKFEKGYQYPKLTYNMDVTSLIFDDDYFEGVICIHVLEHVLEDRKAISEFYRVIKGGGWAIILVPFDENLSITFEDSKIVNPEERLKYFGQTDHVRVCGNDYIRRFEEAGFIIEDLDFDKTISQDDILKFVFKDEKIFLLRKQRFNI